ncbi:NAD(P)-dependent dehydrogenase, short-chain alcohol dehydrogenase family [Nocardioides terrae]|uniref:NAD(P)-dependent dehydrogenase, short-chain alcohol dehydrogenase family n=1 Tax=Nocardioides terrae TaxID=574651 RepID=A0A1I1INK2_9ACTN|nr:SDR family oxidoreductase [Nocardioides terrae]SFC37889.1 NAD(P)-dependent dehydrogenase, short-chain alcohol dehydrogenase family [Nocardioides terrae]
MSGLLEGRSVLVSGGTQGVGAAIAGAALAEGARVVVTGRRAEVGERFVADQGPDAEVRFVHCDVGEPAQVRSAAQATVAAYGGIDCLVNAAGLTTRGTLLDTTPELFDEHVAVNLRGPFLLMQEAVRDMLARKAAGTIVNVLSISAHGGQPYLAPYVASKAGLAALTRNAAHAHRFDRIRINGVNIGWTSTEGEDVTQRRFHDAGDDWREQAAARLPMGRLAEPEDAAALVVLLLSERSGVVTGSVIDWDQTVVGAYD